MIQDTSFLICNPFDGTYYVGFEYGLLKSIDGNSWNAIERFNNKECLEMDTYNSHLVVSVSSDTNGVYFSVDNGDNWQFSSNMYATLVDFAFDNDTILYGIFPDESWSSGLWKSHDFGDTWENEFYSTKMEALGFTGNTIFVGWYQSESVYKGVAIWDKYQNELTFLNEGLPNNKIRNIVEDQFFDCDNITVCTDSGA